MHICTLAPTKPHTSPACHAGDEGKVRGGGLAFAALHSCSEASSLADAAAQIEPASKSGSEQSLELLTSPALGSPDGASVLGSGAADAAGYAAPKQTLTASHAMGTTKSDAGQTRPLTMPDDAQAALCSHTSPLPRNAPVNLQCMRLGIFSALHRTICWWSCRARHCNDDMELRSGAQNHAHGAGSPAWLAKACLPVPALSWSCITA